MLSLKLKTGNKKLFLINVPAELILSEGLSSTCDSSPEIVVGFINTTNDLAKIVNSYNKSNPLAKTILNVIYFKKANNLGHAGINRDEMMGLGKGFGLEACRLINVNENYSCMGFRPTEEFKQINQNKPSQCVDDYLDKIPALINMLNDEAKIKFAQLTIGYQKGWARYVFGVVQEKTRQKRLETANIAISQGFKAIDMYQSANK